MEWAYAALRLNIDKDSCKAERLLHVLHLRCREKVDIKIPAATGDIFQLA
jgi:hypothetical protein